MTPETILLVILLVTNLVMLYKLGKSYSEAEIENTVHRALDNVGLAESIGQLKTQVEEIRTIGKKLEDMLKTPIGRGGFGEETLEKILRDQLPPDMYRIRGRLENGKIPDAWIESTAGKICIDAKFPLHNYIKMTDSEDKNEIEKYKRQFRRDVESMLRKVADDYIRPEIGTADFAIVFIPSESVYHYIVTELYDLVKEYSQKGVLVASPLTLSHKIQLIRAGVHAQMLNEKAEKVLNEIRNLSNIISEIDDRWNKLYNTHLRNLKNTAESLDYSFKRLKDEFERIQKLS